MYLYYIMAEAEKGQQLFSNQFQTEDTYFTTLEYRCLTLSSGGHTFKKKNRVMLSYSPTAL